MGLIPREKPLGHFGKLFLGRTTLGLFGFQISIEVVKPARISRDLLRYPTNNPQREFGDDSTFCFQIGFWVRWSDGIGVFGFLIFHFENPIVKRG